VKDSLLERLLISEEDEISTFVFAHNGKHIIIGHESGVISKWDIKRSVVIFKH